MLPGINGFERYRAIAVATDIGALGFQAAGLVLERSLTAEKYVGVKSTLAVRRRPRTYVLHIARYRNQSSSPLVCPLLRGL